MLEIRRVVALYHCTPTPVVDWYLCASTWLLVGLKGASCLCPQNLPLPGPQGRASHVGFYLSPDTMNLCLASEVGALPAPIPRDLHFLALTFRRVFFKKGKWVGLCVPEGWGAGLGWGGKSFDRTGLPVSGLTRDLNITPAYTLKNEEFLKFYLFPHYPLLRWSPLHAVLHHR